MVSIFFTIEFFTERYDRIWADQKHKKLTYENYTEEKREHPELAAFEHADGSDGLRDEDIQ